MRVTLALTVLVGLLGTAAASPVWETIGHLADGSAVHLGPITVRADQRRTAWVHVITPARGGKRGRELFRFQVANCQARELATPRTQTRAAGGPLTSSRYDFAAEFNKQDPGSIGETILTSMCE